MTARSIADLTPARAAPDLAALAKLEERMLWLAAWTIHNANHLRESRDGLKVGGHQASCASMTTIMTALFFHALKPQDRIAVKPHASPLFHAIQYMLGRQTREQLEGFRALGGAQSYPSRTKDKDDVDYSTGSVGLGVAVTAFGSLVQDYLAARGKVAPENMGRFIATVGDAELDEGNVYEALIEACKHDLRNIWWIVDYNRQSLDAVTPDRMFDRFDDIFAAAGWRVETLKYGRRLRDSFKAPGGAQLREWIDACPNDLYAALCFEGGASWRERLDADLKGPAQKLLAGHDDESLARLMTSLGGHCLETMIEAFDRAASSETPIFMLAYTVKGWRLPFQGHKDNHSGLMNPTQMDAFRTKMGVPEGREWEPFAGLPIEIETQCKAALQAAPWSADVQRQFEAQRIPIPSRADFPRVDDAEISTQAAFGKILNDIARTGGPLADAIVTTSPDVSVSTNLGAWVNRRGLFNRKTDEDVFRKRKIASAQIWTETPAGQHIELGIAEHNLFLNLAAFGLSAPHFGERLLPIGTLYDPFIARGLDALNYACYQDARFILVATPSGVTLGPEGGAHQSISTPLIGMGQAGLTSWEPAFADEVCVLMRHALEHMQADDGESSYFRLSTRALTQPKRESDAWEADALKGAYWLIPPGPDCDLVIAYQGALAPEALEAHARLLDDHPGAGLLAITSADLLHRDWTAAGRRRWVARTVGAPPALSGRQVAGATSHIASLLSGASRHAGIVTLIDGSPSALSWLGGVHGHRVRALGVENFGQTGDLPDLYRIMRLDADAILDAAADLALD
ncbi:MAG: transketolase [Alphaproteobacteria bacterium]|nr:transketolase [Alphaproteobacteria bacterium]